MGMLVSSICAYVLSALWVCQEVKALFRIEKVGQSDAATGSKGLSGKG